MDSKCKKATDESNTCLFMKKVQKYESLYKKFSKKVFNGKLFGEKKMKILFSISRNLSFSSPAYKSYKLQQVPLSKLLLPFSRALRQRLLSDPCLTF